MRIAVIGAGRVGQALGARWSEVGHDVVYGVRDPSDPRHAALGSPSTAAEAVAGADVVLVALPWDATREVLESLDLASPIVIDATNPLAAGARELASHPELSGAELVAQWARSTRVVKAFNPTGSANMLDPNYGAARVMMPIASDDEQAKSTVIELAGAIGFEGVDAGPLSAARDLEHFAALWIRLAYPLGNGPGIAFSLLRR